MWNPAAMAFGVGPLASMSAIDALTAHGSAALKQRIATNASNLARWSTSTS
jgi:hypothetical protein